MKKTVYVLFIILMVLMLTGAKCNKTEIQLTPLQAAGLQIVSIWTTADKNGNGVIDSNETITAGIASMEVITIAQPGLVQWEGKMKTPEGRAAFIQEGVLLFKKYSSQE